MREAAAMKEASCREINRIMDQASRLYKLVDEHGMMSWGRLFEVGKKSQNDVKGAERAGRPSRCLKVLS